jgi:hypothetical protein
MRAPSGGLALLKLQVDDVWRVPSAFAVPNQRICMLLPIASVIGGTLVVRYARHHRRIA